MLDTPAPIRPAVLPVPAASRSERCAMALVMGSGEQMSLATACLLRKRLSIAALIAFFPNFFLLILSQVSPDTAPRWFGIQGVVFDVIVTVTAGVLAAVLWSSRTLTGATLRLMEVVLFGTTAAFFAWLHACLLAEPEFLEWIDPREPPGTVQKLLTTVTLISGLRWFFLIVLYGVFIPSSWKRCAVFVGIAAVTPVVITVVLGLADERLRPHLLTPVLVLAMVLASGSAIAVFGSRRMSVLNEEVSKFQKLGQYRLHARLGAGGMGEVFLAEHLLLRRPCAIKLIHAEHAGDARQLSRFEREVKAMANLTHWNTALVFDYGQTEDGVFYYVMEYLPGQNLDSLVTRNGPLPPGRVVHLLRQVCLALREAHGVGLLHRDIKPSNVIACQRGGFHDVVKLLDFGLVQDQGLAADGMKLTVQGTILGSPPFMSPEQSRGRPLTASSDIYSVGGVAYFLLTGKPPFVRETMMEVLIAHASDAVTPPRHLRPEVPADLEAVVLRCLEKDIQNRYPDAASLEKALAGCACAGEWTEELAAEWWRTHGETVSVQRPEDLSTKALTPLSV